jgi:predicted naringenin-chalcone synthase
MVPPVNVLAVTTAVPPHKLEQRAVANAAREVYARTFARYPKLADVFINVGIDRRHSVRSLEWLSAPHDLAERTKVYLEGASEASAAGSTGTPTSFAYIMRIRSSGRGRLPVWVVRKRSRLRCTA